MKKNLTLLLKTFLFLVLLGTTLFVVALLVQRKESYVKNADFFNEARENHLDVLFLGSSHVINGVNPVTLYEDYGITSYNLGGHGSLMQETYWQLIRALDYCKPEYVVVDCYMLEKNYQYLDECEEGMTEDEITTSIEQLHLNMDAYPFSRLKMAALKDLVKDPDIRNQFLFDFIVYHDRWSELVKEDFGRLSGSAEINELMGAELRYGVKTDVDVYEPCGEGEVLPEHTVGEEYLMKIIDECQRDGIGVLLVYLPFSANTTDQIAANTAEEVAARYNVPYINMLKTEGVIDEASDLNDHGHLNAVGAVKVTEKIGEWLTQNADIPDHRGESGYEKWDSRCLEYHENIIDNILKGEDLRSELNILTEKDVSSILFINQESDAFDDEGLVHLVENLSGTDKVKAAASEKGPYILINDAASGQSYEASGEEVLESVQTAMGELVYIPVEKNFRLLYPMDDENMNYLYDDSHTGEDIQLIIYDNKSGEVLKHLYYTTQLHEYLPTY